MCYLCEISILALSNLQGDCSDGRLTHYGGAAQSDRETYGCRSGCPTTGRQVHIIAQTGGNSLWIYSDGTTAAPEVWKQCDVHLY